MQQSHSVLSPSSASRLLFILGVFFLTLSLSGATWYVNGSAASSGNGRSWGQALCSLQQAIEAASPGDSIWVAAGVYHPEHVREIEGVNAFASSFELKDGLTILGGFQGNETTPNQRQLLAEGIYAWDFKHPTVLRQQEDVIGSVLRTGSRELATGVILDGLVIEQGRATGSLDDGHGGAIQGSGKLVVRNCLLRQNLARHGGAIYWEGELTVQASGLLDNELVAEGWSGIGGAVAVFGDGFSLTHLLCAGNGSRQQGVQSGGALFLEGNGTVEHCTIVRNHAVRNASGLWLAGGATLLNSIVWNNTGSTTQILAEQGSIAFTAIENHLADGLGNIPLLHDNAGPNGPQVNDNWVDGYYPCFLDPDQRDFRLAAGSYLLNRGHRENLQEPVCDATGQNVQFCLPADIGACASNLKGNLALDFSADYPYIYGASSEILAFLGYATPDMTTAYIVMDEQTASLEQDDDYQWQATWLQTGAATITLYAETTGADAQHWNTFMLTRTISVTPRPLVIAAHDAELRVGSDKPELNWSIVAGKLVGNDTIVGSPECDVTHAIGSTVPITRGTLSVQDGNNGQNYRLVFHEGLLSCLKGLADIEVTAEASTYNGQPQPPHIITSPEDLSYAVTYEGTNGTEYPATTQPPTDTGNYSVTVTVHDDTYEGEFVFTYSITPATLTITADNQQRPYRHDNPTLTMTCNGFLGHDTRDSIVLPDISTPATLDSPVTAQGYPILLQGGSARNYQLSLVPGTLTITPASPNAPTQPETTPITFGDTLASASFVQTYVEPSGTYHWNAPGHMPAAGEHTFTWTFQPDDPQNYTTQTGQATVTVHKRNLTVTTQALSYIYGNSEPDIVARITHGSLLGSDTLTGKPAREAGDQVGTYQTTGGTLSAGDNYTITFVPNTVTITPRPVTITAKAAAKHIGQPDPELAWTITAGSLVNQDAPTGQLSRDAGETPGTYAIVQGSLQLNGNYDLTFIPANFSITKITPGLTPDSLVTSAITYGQTLAEARLNATITDPLSGQTIPGTWSWNHPDATPDAGITTHTWTFTPSDTQTYAPLTGEAAVTIRKATLYARLEHDSYSRCYLENNPEFKVILSGFVNGDTFATAVDSLPTPTTNASKTSPPGQYHVSLVNGVSQNYAFSTTEATLTVTNATPTCNGTVTAQNITYGQDVLQATLQGTFLDANYNIIPGQLLWTQNTPSRPNAGTVQREWTFFPANPYFKSLSGYTTVTVDKAMLTVTANSYTITRGEPLPEFTLSYAGFVNGDDASALSSLPVATCTATSSATPGSFPITLSGGQAQNYELKLVNGTLTVGGLQPIPNNIAGVTFQYGYRFDERFHTATYYGNDDFGKKYFNNHLLLAKNDQNRISKVGDNLYFINSISSLTAPLAYFLHPTTGLNVSGEFVIHDPVEWLEWLWTDEIMSAFYDENILYYKLEFIEQIFDGLLPVGEYPNIPWTFYPDPKHTDLVPVTGFMEVSITPICITAYGKSPKERTTITYSGLAGKVRNYDWYVYPEDAIINTNSQIGGCLYYALYGDPRDITMVKGWGNEDCHIVTNGIINKNYQVSNYSNDLITVLPKPGTVRFVSSVFSYASNCKPYLVSDTHPELSGFNFIVNGLVTKTITSKKIQLVSFSSCYSPDRTIQFTLEQTQPAYFYLSSYDNGNPIEMDSHTIFYGDPIPELTATAIPRDKDLKISHVNGYGEIQGEACSPGTYNILAGNISAVKYNNEIITQQANNMLNIFPGQLTILKRPLTIRVKPIYKQQGQGDPSPQWEVISGTIVNNDELTGSFSRESGEMPGTYQYTLGSFGHPCYDITLTEDSCLVILQDEPLAWDFSQLAASPLAYGQDLHQSTITGNLAHPLTGETLKGTWTWLDHDQPVLDGTLEFYAQLTTDDPFINNQLPPIPFTIPLTARTINVTLHQQNMLWGEPLPRLTYSHDPLLDGDSLQGEPVAVWDESQACYRVTPGTLAPPNDYYQLDFGNQPAFVIVHKRRLAIQVNNATKTLGDDDPDFTFRIISGSLASGDALQQVHFQREEGEEAGSYAISITQVDIPQDPQLQHYALTLIPGALTINEDGAPSRQTARIVAAPSWASSCQNGQIVDWDGEKYIFGVNAFATLHEAIQAVMPGGVVLLAPEFFPQSNNPSKIQITKPLSLIGTTANDGTTTRTNAPLVLADHRVTHFQALNIHFTGGYTDQIPIRIMPDVGHVIVTHCQFTTKYGALIINEYQGSVTILNNTFTATDERAYEPIQCIQNPNRNFPDTPLMILDNNFNNWHSPIILGGYPVIATDNVNKFGPLSDLLILEPGQFFLYPEW